MRKEDKKCPRCKKGTMMMVLATTPQGPGGKTRPMQARCDKCGHECNYTAMYKRSKK